MARTSPVLLLSALLLAAACGGGGSTGNGNPADVAGAWLGTAIHADAATSVLCLRLTQDNSNVQGSIGGDGPSLAGLATHDAVALVVQSSAGANGAAGLLSGALLTADLKDDLLAGNWVAPGGNKGTWAVKRSPIGCP
jgi:hypothetical protein